MYFLSQNERLVPKPSIHYKKIELNNGSKSEKTQMLRKLEIFLRLCRTESGRSSWHAKSQFFPFSLIHSLFLVYITAYMWFLLSYSLRENYRIDGREGQLRIENGRTFGTVTGSVSRIPGLYHRISISFRIFCFCLASSKIKHRYY